MSGMLERAAQAVDSTVAVKARSLVLRAVVRRARESGLIVQCAWCGRIGDGGEAWAHIDGLFLRPEQVTGSICRGCLAANSPQPDLEPARQGH